MHQYLISGMDNSPVLALLGPTASGKTNLAIAVAKQLKAEVIGLDSRQIYKGMAIGTAQPTLAEQDGIPHHLIGFRPPTETISAGEYAKLVQTCISDIVGRDAIPLICGGAGLYYRAITRGIFEGSVSDLEIRKKLDREYDESGGGVLLERLRKIDPEYAGITHPNNRKRLVRALEIYESTGKTPTQHFKDQQLREPPKVKTYSVYLALEMDYLEKRIRKRTITMLAAGWIDEVETLLKMYPDEELPAINSIGYRQICRYIQHDLSKDDLVDEIVLRTRQFARRQIQWFKKEPVDLVLNVDEKTVLSNLVDKVVMNYTSR